MSSAFDQQMAVAMEHMMQAMHHGAHGADADTAFLAMMIPHHAGAVDMARLVLQHGRDPATRQLADEIIAGQTVEIQSMQRRLAILRRRGSGDGEFPALGGTRGG